MTIDSFTIGTVILDRSADGTLSVSLDSLHASHGMADDAFAIAAIIDTYVTSLNWQLRLIRHAK